MAATPSWQVEFVKLHALLVQRRKALGLREEDVAARLGRGIATFQRWESGRGHPRSPDLFRWAAALGVSITSNLMGSSASGSGASHG